MPVDFSVARNLEVILEVLTEARPGDLVVTPEGSLTGYPVNGPSDLDRLRSVDPLQVTQGVDSLAREAARRGVHLWIGVCRQRDGEWANEALGLLADGTRMTYRKVNLATAERGMFRAGDELPVFEIPLASGRVPIGVQLCRELRFPEQWRSLAERGAKLFLHLNHGRGDSTVFETWRAMLIARAAENQRFIVSVNAVSASQHCPTMVVAPDGSVLADVAAGAAQVRRIDIDLGQTTDRFLAERRLDLRLP
jgi:predicted amidohydrolase